MTQKTIVFDFGGVLFKTSATAFYQDRFQERGRSTDELEHFLTRVFTKADRSSANLGMMRDVIARKAAENPEWAEEVRAFGADRDFIKQVRGVIPGMQETLNDLAQAGHRITGLTNWAGDTYDTLPKAFPGILGHFNHVVVSGKVGIKKPDPQIFTLMHRELGNPDPESVYYFDDKKQNTQMACQTVGWHGIVFESAEAVRKALGLPALRP